MVNPQFPAAVGMRSLSVMRVMSVTLGAFAQVAPEIMPAACGDGGPLINVRTTDNKTGRQLMANLDPITGGGGGTPFRDGAEGSGANFAFLKNTPVEINEAEVPVKIRKYGLAPNSGGAGRWRGGLGQRRVGDVVPVDVESPHLQQVRGSGRSSVHLGVAVAHDDAGRADGRRLGTVEIGGGRGLEVEAGERGL